MINPIPELKMINPMNQSKIRPKTPKAPPNLLLNSLLPLTTASLACSTFFLMYQCLLVVRTSVTSLM